MKNDVELYTSSGLIRFAKESHCDVTCSSPVVPKIAGFYCLFFDRWHLAPVFRLWGLRGGRSRLGLRLFSLTRSKSWGRWIGGSDASYKVNLRTVLVLGKVEGLMIPDRWESEWSNYLLEGEVQKGSWLFHMIVQIINQER